MTNFRKVWTLEIDAWLLEHKQLPRKERFELFLKTFPDIQDVTFTAFCNECCRVGAVTYHVEHGSTRCKPLYSEQQKKGYIRIKIAQPNVWIFKHRWIYEQTHPDYVYNKGDMFIFLNGNNRDFRPENIERISRKYIIIFNNIGGTCPDNPELTRLHIIQAEMKYKMLDLAEKTGQTVNHGARRRLKSDIEDYYEKVEKTRRNDPEYRKKQCERAKASHKRRMQDPEYARKFREKHRVYLKEYNRRKKENL